MVSHSQSHAPDTWEPFAYPSPAEKELPRNFLHSLWKRTKKINNGGEGRGEKKSKKKKTREKILVKVAQSKLGLLQKLLILQEQHPESTKNNRCLERQRENRAPLSKNNHPLPPPAATRDPLGGGTNCWYLSIVAESEPMLWNIWASLLCVLTEIN